MAAILDISATVPEATIKDFTRACNRYRDELGNNQAIAMRRGMIALIKGLRARTAKAKQQAPLKDVTKYNGPGPHYITPKSGFFRRTFRRFGLRWPGKKLQPQHRWAVRRKGGTEAKTYIYPAKSKAAARTRGGQYKKWGLAKKSWGWFMKALFHRANPESNPNAKIDNRMVEYTPLRVITTGNESRVECEIVNKLDYIREALPEAALSAAMAAATRYIDGQIDKGLAKARKELT